MATPTTLPSTFVAGNVLTAAEMNNLRGAFRVLQVVSTTKTDLFTTSSATFVDVTGTTATITPSATSSKILVISAGVCSATGAGSQPRINLRRGTTDIAQSTGATNNQTITAVDGSAADINQGWTVCFLDSPNTTSATNYLLRLATPAGTVRIGGNSSTPVYGGVTTMTVMEISA